MEYEVEMHTREKHITKHVCVIYIVNRDELLHVKMLAIVFVTCKVLPLV